MEKLERTYIITHYSTIKGLPDIRYVKVKESDLDKLEQDAQHVMDKYKNALDEIIRLEQQRDEAFEAMITFCKRVDNYEVRSKKTYAQFKAILEKTYGQTWEEIKVGKK